MSNQNSNVRAAFAQSTASKMYKGRNNNNFETTTSKLVRGNETAGAIRDGELPIGNANDPYVHGTMSRSVTRIKDNANVLQLLPDIRLAIEIIIGGILSPKDLMNTALTFSSSSDVFKDKAGALLNKIEDHFTTSYKLKDDLSTMLWDILGKTGSYPLAVLPETTVDYMINSNSRVTMEALTSTLYDVKGSLLPLGLVANRKSAEDTSAELSAFQLIRNMSMEDYTPYAQGAFDARVGEESFMLSITDNYDVLKVPSLSRKVSTQYQNKIVADRRSKINTYGADKKGLCYSREAISLVTPDDQDDRPKKEQNDLDKLYPHRQFRNVPIFKVKPRTRLDKENIGHPMVLKLPTEAVIPIYSPNDPRDHLGYLVALDNTGIPLRLAEMENIYRSIMSASNASTTNNAVSWAMQTVSNQTSPDMRSGAKDFNAMQALERATPIYRQMVESELIDRISRGTLGNGISMGRNDSVWSLMLARAMVGRQTQMLYIPSSLMSYLAVDFDEYGLGKTLIDDTMTISALRSLQMFINSMASSKNAITRRVLRASLDPAEKNPQRALQMILHEYAKATRYEYPITQNPIDQINYLQMAGIQLDLEEHPRMPSTKFNVDFEENDYKKIDTEYDDWLKKLHTMAIGLSPEVIDSAGSADFATQAIFANVVTSRRILQLSEKFCASLSEFVQRYVFNSQILMDDLAEVLENEQLKFKNQFGDIMSTEEVLGQFIETIAVSLPLPDLNSIKEQKEAFQDISDFYDSALDSFISEEWLTAEEVGSLGENGIAGTKAFMKALFLRRWMRSNGVANELFDLSVKDKDGKPMIDLLKEKEEYLDGMGITMLEMAKQRYKRIDKLNKANDKAKKGLQLDGADSSDGGGFGGEDGFGAGEGSDGGFGSEGTDPIDGMDDSTDPMDNPDGQDNPDENQESTDENQEPSKDENNPDEEEDKTE